MSTAAKIAGGDTNGSGKPTFSVPLPLSPRDTFTLVAYIWDSESLAVAYDVMATARLVVDLNTGFAFTCNVENSLLCLTVD